MKTLLVLLVCSTGFAQEFVATRTGLASKKDITQNYVILNFDETSADTLYVRAKKYIQKKYSGARDVVSSDDQNKTISFETAGNGIKTVKKNNAETVYLADYKSNIEVKEGKLKITYSNIDIYTEAKDGEKKRFPFDSYWNAKGKVIDAETKKIVEDNFNASTRILANELKTKDAKTQTGW